MDSVSHLVLHLSFRSVVVITCASHAQGPRFEPGRKQDYFFNVFILRDKSIILIGTLICILTLKIEEGTIVSFKRTFICCCALLLWHFVFLGKKFLVFCQIWILKIFPPIIVLLLVFPRKHLIFIILGKERFFVVHRFVRTDIATFSF